MAGTLAGRLAGVALGAVLLVAGIAKRADRDWPSTARAMGAPVWSVRIVPSLEIVLGALLVAGVARPYVAALAAAVLLAFTATILANLARGRRPPCACFGTRSRRPMGLLDLVRNGALLALALVAMIA